MKSQADAESYHDHRDRGSVEVELSEPPDICTGVTTIIEIVDPLKQTGNGGGNGRPQLPRS